MTDESTAIWWWLYITSNTDDENYTAGLWSHLITKLSLCMRKQVVQLEFHEVKGRLPHSFDAC